MRFVFDAIGCLGHAYADAELSALLDAMLEHKLDLPSDGTQYAISKAGGFDLLFEDADPGKSHRQMRVLTGIFLYADDVDGHRSFQGELPFGFTLHDSRRALIAKRPPSRTWVIGEGRVRADHPQPDSGAWETPDFNLHATYCDDGEVRWFQNGLPVTLSAVNEWRSESTWQDLAKVPEQKKRRLSCIRKSTASRPPMRCVQSTLLSLAVKNLSGLSEVRPTSRRKPALADR